jgi:HEAT repeat protein
VRAALVAVILAVGACGGSGSSVVASGTVPPFPTDFTPPPALGHPPTPDPSVRGYMYLDAVYAGLHGPWTQFLEDCRLRLPPTHPLNKPALEALAELDLDPHGGVLELRITGSGNDEFDAAVTQVLRDRAPFPVPPAGLLSDDGHLHLAWRFARDVRQAGIVGAEVVVIQWGIDRAIPMLLAEGRVGDAALRLAREPATTPNKAELAEQVFSAVITEAIDAHESGVRRLAVETAGRTPIPSAAASLRGRARGAVDSITRAGTFMALATLADGETANLAIEALDEGPTGGTVVITGAAAALDKIGAADRARPIIAAWLRGAARGDPNALSVSLAALAALPAAELLPQVIAAVAKSDARVRATACPVYGRAAADGTPAAWAALAAGLRDADASVRAACATAAGTAAATGATDKKTATGLVARLADRDLTVRAAAVIALARIDRTRAASELRDLAKEDSPVVLAALAEAWSLLPRPPVDKVRQLARHTDPAVRAAAITGLIRLGDQQSLDAAALHAGDAAEPVRLAALPAIRAEVVLRELTRDAAIAVRAAAEERLIAVLGRAATIDERLAAVAAAERGSFERVQLAASWLLAR